MHPDDKYKQKLEKARQKRPNTSENRLIIDISIYSVIIFIIVALYYFVQQGTFTYRIANRAIADVGMLLIGLSMALSAICYFWDFADAFIMYRKQLGLAGFAFALAHSILSLFFMPKFFPFPSYYLAESNLLPFISALIALVIYTAMALISNRFAMQKLGGKLWKGILRVGYIAYFFTILHFGLKGYPYWLNWFSGKSDNIFPSFGLIVFLFGIVVLVLRIMLWFSAQNKKKAATINANESTLSQSLQKEGSDTV